MRVGNEENSCRRRCHDFRLARAFAALPQRTSEDCVGYGALVGNPSVARYKKTIAIVSSLVCSGHEFKTSTIIDNFQFAANSVHNVISD